MLRKLSVKDFNQVWKLQAGNLEEFSNMDMFVGDSKEDILDALENDICFGVFTGEQLIAFCFIILNRDINKNFGKKFADQIKYDINTNNTLTFANVQVRKDYRGNGIQKRLLMLTENIVRDFHCNYIMASVSPINLYSQQNFLDCQYENVFQTSINESPYNGVTRLIFIKRLFI